MESQLLNLPAEIRTPIWQYALDYSGSCLRHATEDEVEAPDHQPAAGLLSACRRTYAEGIHLFFAQNLIHLPCFDTVVAGSSCSAHTPAVVCSCRPLPRTGCPIPPPTPDCQFRSCFSPWQTADGTGKLRRLRVAEPSLAFLQRLSLRSEIFQRLGRLYSELPAVLLWVRDRAPQLAYVRLDLVSHGPLPGDYARVALGDESGVRQLVKTQRRLFRTVRSIRGLKTVELCSFRAPETSLPKRAPNRILADDDDLLRDVVSVCFPHAQEVCYRDWIIPGSEKRHVLEASLMSIQLEPLNARLKKRAAEDD